MKNASTTVFVLATTLMDTESVLALTGVTPSFAREDEQYRLITVVHDSVKLLVVLPNTPALGDPRIQRELWSSVTNGILGVVTPERLIKAVKAWIRSRLGVPCDVIAQTKEFIAWANAMSAARTQRSWVRDSASASANDEVVL